MTTVKIEQKETKTKSPTASTIKRKTREIGESSLKPQEVETKTGKSKKKNESSRQMCEQRRCRLVPK